jgi:hypothetical protein
MAHLAGIPQQMTWIAWQKSHPRGSIAFTKEKGKTIHQIYLD